MISIALPINNMQGAEFFLKRCLDSIAEQTYKDFEVVITDNSKDTKLANIVYSYVLLTKYYKNEDKPTNGISQNTNQAIKHSTGDLIKILYMDDWFSDKDALGRIVDGFKDNWLITPSDNNPNPYYTEDIYMGNNKLGSPSALTIKNDNPLLFDESLFWLLDCDYYKRMYDKYGEPTILPDVGVNIGVHEGQTTNTLSDKIKEEEYERLKIRFT
jgi:glycosyltransferase involved in cell wall biosynthesis